MGRRRRATPSLRLRETGAGTYALTGELAFDSVGSALGEEAGLFSGDASPVVDLSGVTRTDSAGLALLIHWMREARARERAIVFRNIPSQMWDIARTTGVDGFLAPPVA